MLEFIKNFRSRHYIRFASSDAGMLDDPINGAVDADFLLSLLDDSNSDQE